MNAAKNSCRWCGEPKSAHVPVTLRCFPGTHEYYEPNPEQPLPRRLANAQWRTKLESAESRIAELEKQLSDLREATSVGMDRAPEALRRCGCGHAKSEHNGGHGQCAHQLYGCPCENFEAPHRKP